MDSRAIACVIGATMLFGCGGPQNPRDEDLTAEEHEREAANEERAANDEEAQFDPGAREQPQGGNPNFHGTEVYNPTASHIVEAERHRDHAAAHRARAAELRAFEQDECARFPAETRVSCPLLLGLTSLDDIEGGVELTFDPEMDNASIIDHLRCHIAFAAAQGREGIDHCALYVHGTQLDADGNVVRLTTSDEGRVEELRRRAHLQAP